MQAGHSEPFGPLAPGAVERIVSILGEQVPDPFDYPQERRAFFRHAEKARRIPGWRKFNKKTRSETERWLSLEARRSDDPDYLLELLANHLLCTRIVRPAPSTVERLVAHAKTDAQEWITRSVAYGLSQEHKERIDGLRKLKSGAHRTRFILRYFDEPDFRRRISAGLDRMENFNCSRDLPGTFDREEIGRSVRGAVLTGSSLPTLSFRNPIAPLGDFNGDRTPDVGIGQPSRIFRQTS